MSLTILRLLESWHGQLGILAVAALVHPAILLRRGKVLSRGAKLAIVLATMLVVVAFGSGVFIYDDYRELVKRDLFKASPTAGLLFETKEHLGYGAMALAVGAAVCALAAPRKAIELRRLSAIAFAGSAALTLAVGVLGNWIAAVWSFPS